MKIRPLIFVSAVCVLVNVAPLRAQPATRPASGAGRGEMLLQRIDKTLEDIQLSDEQKQKINDILASARQDMQKMAGELQQMGQQERAGRVREFMMGLREKISSELTDAQKEVFQQRIQQMRGPGGPGGAPSTQPGAGERPMALLQRLQESIQKLDLTDDQKAQIKSIVSDMRDKLADLREKSNGDLDKFRDGAREMFADTREKMSKLLTPEQQQKLRDMLQGPAPDGGPPRGRFNRGQDNPPRMQDEKPADKPQGKQPKPDEPKTDAGPPPGPAIGQAAPEFNLQKLDGRPVQLSSFNGKILVLVFGSYSSPSFRQRAAAIQELAQNSGSRASFLIVYTKEAHPKDGWQVDRNRDDKVLVAAHTDAVSRNLAAKHARESLKLTAIPVAADDMNDSVANAYGAGENSAYVIDRDGKILARQQWLDPFGVRRIIDEAAGS